jgi:hypothetical protein
MHELARRKKEPFGIAAQCIVMNKAGNGKIDIDI